MSDESRNRVHKRYDVDWRVSLKCPDWKLAGSVAAANASRGGLFVLTTQLPPIGSIVELGVELPDGQSLMLRGTIVHVVTPERAAATGEAAGIGVKFLDEHETDLVLLEQMAQASQAPPRKPSYPPGALRPLGRGPVLAQIAVKRRFVHPSGEVAPIVGIDLGTSYASIAGIVGGKLFVIPDEQQRTVQPCLVYLGERGSAQVGWEARERLLDRPRAVVSGPRRLLGRRADDPSLRVPIASSLVRIVAGEDGAPRVEVEGVAYDAEKLCGAILSHLRALAERDLRVSVRKAVLSVPPHFGEPQWLALRRAADRAGLEVLDLVPEPVCAALASGASAAPGQKVVVFDLGGGTLDVSLLEGAGDTFRVVAHDWDSQLGGDQIDLIVAQAVADAFWRVTGLELRSRIEAWLPLIHACEKAKHDLSSEDQTHITVDGLIEEPERFDLRQRLDRADLEMLVIDFVGRCLAACRSLLERAGVEPAEISAVVAAGGSTRVPLVRQELARLFSQPPLAFPDPDEATCLGAGLRAAQLARHRVSATG